MKAPENAPEEIKKFVDLLISNGCMVFNNDDGEADTMFAESVPYIEQGEDGRWEVCDNYDGRFFRQIYYYDPETGKWTFRRMYSEMPEMPYSFEQAMSDATIMFTG